MLDSNALLDFYTSRDLVDAYGAAFQRLGTAADKDPKFAYRRTRARESLLLMIFLHDVGATTFTYADEALRKLEEAAPPALDGGISLAKDHTSFVIYFVKDYVLPKWDARFMQPTESASDWPSLIACPSLRATVVHGASAQEILRPKGNRADLYYVAMAKKHRLSIITNEGFGEGGYTPGKISRWAEREGVPSLLPRHVYAGRLDERAASKDFLHRFSERAPSYLEQRRRELGDDLASRVLEWMHAFYRYVLLGEQAD